MSTAWERLSEEQKEALKKEYEELQMWDRKQRQIRERRLKEEGKWIYGGLDTNQNEFADIIAERNRRFRELQKKYDFR